MTMRTEEYKAYLMSPKWQAISNKRMQIDGYRCTACECMGNPPDNPLVVHHISYDNIGNENIYKDLTTLCQCCHERVHNMLQRVQSENGDRKWKNIHPKIAYVQTRLNEEPKIIKLTGDNKQ